MVSIGNFHAQFPATYDEAMYQSIRVSEALN